MAEWSKALASGASPQGRGFEPHSCHRKRGWTGLWRRASVYITHRDVTNILNAHCSITRCRTAAPGCVGPARRPLRHLAVCGTALTYGWAQFRACTPQRLTFKTPYNDSLAEWSKALASGASPQGRGFEPHSCQIQRWTTLPEARELQTSSCHHRFVKLIGLNLC